MLLLVVANDVDELQVAAGELKGEIISADRVKKIFVGKTVLAIGTKVSMSYYL